jgi:hypothetical protein
MIQMRQERPDLVVRPAAGLPWSPVEGALGCPKAPDPAAQGITTSGNPPEGAPNRRTPHDRRVCPDARNNRVRLPSSAVGLFAGTDTNRLSTYEAGSARYSGPGRGMRMETHHLREGQVLDGPLTNG